MSRCDRISFFYTTSEQDFHLNIELHVRYEVIIKLTTADLNWLIFFFSPDSLILHNLNLFGDIYEQEFYFFSYTL